MNRLTLLTRTGWLPALLVTALIGAAYAPHAAAQQDPSVEEADDAAQPVEPEAEPMEVESVSVPDAIPESPHEQGAVPMDKLNAVEEFPEPFYDEPMLKGATLKLQLRNYYFHRERYNGTHAEAWAQGGALAFKSGYLLDRFAVGAVLYGSFPLQGEDGRQGSSILDTEPGGYRLRLNPIRGDGFQPFLEQRIHQDSYVVLGQIYAEVKLIDGLQLNLGRKEYNTPFINMHDVRMTPKTFEAYTLTGVHDGAQEGSQWRYGLGYFTKMKNWTDSDFDWMSDEFGIEEHRGVFAGGVNYSTPTWSLGAIDYYSDDVINIFYTEGSYGWKFTPDISLKLSGQFVDQRSTGDDFITGDDFDVQQYGLKADVGLWGGTLTLAYTDVTGGRVDVRSPWGGYPGYTSVQFGDFNRADENAFMVKGAYDLTRHGLDGLSFYALYVHGTDRNELNPGQPFLNALDSIQGGTPPREAFRAALKTVFFGEPSVYNEDEWNLNLQWAPKEGWARNMNWRVRYAEIDQRGGGSPETKDFRVIVNYNFALK